MYSLVSDIFRHIHTSMLYVGGTHGACSCYLRTPRSEPHGALYHDCRPSRDLSRLVRGCLKMPQAGRPMCNTNCTTTCSAASWPMAFSAWAVIPASTRCCCPSVASSAGFFRRVLAGAWHRPPPTWSSASFPGFRCHCGQRQTTISGRGFAGEISGESVALKRARHPPPKS